MIEWIYFPKSDRPHPLCEKVVQTFEANLTGIGSGENKLNSNSVLASVADGLRHLGFAVETGKKRGEKISMPVLFTRNGRVAKAFEVDAFHARSLWLGPILPPNDVQLRAISGAFVAGD